MESKQKVFIISILVVVVLVVGLGFLLNKPGAPSKYEDFAKTLTADGTRFFGAFWCPHCQAEEAQFEMSRQRLEQVGLYHECSNADRTQTQICIDNKIESYPTWFFKDGITVTSNANPTICKVAPGSDDEPSICRQPGAESSFFRTWYFPTVGFSIRSDADPVRTGDNWKFPATASATGEIPLPFLAQQINYTLPQ
jgi:hypothetical protein